MPSNDLRGNPVSTASGAALAAAETALWRMMSFYDVPLADLGEAAAADPGWVMPAVMHAGFLFSLTEPALHAEAQQLLHSAARCATAPTPREQAHLAAVQQLAEGRWHAACQTWDTLLLEHPRDALALQWAQLWDFYTGNATQLRQRAARVLPEWDSGDPLHPYVLGLYAFGLEECNLYAQAEDVGRAALAADPRGPWAIHAVAHVMEMQGRFEEGGAWLRQHQAAWAEGNGFATHLWWHKALYRLEALDIPGAWRLVDSHISGEALQITLQRIDAAAMLWRLALLGEDVSAAAAALADAWPREDPGQPAGAGAAGHAGYYAFNDVHFVLALLGAGRIAEAEGWTARCAGRAMNADDARRSNHVMARDVGLPLMRALIAFARGDHDAAAQGLYPVRMLAQRFGGSHAQRDLIDQTLIAAAARGSERALGRALLNERRMAKAATPLTRHWQEALGIAERQAT